MNDKTFRVYTEHDFRVYLKSEFTHKYFKTGYPSIDSVAMPRTAEITMVPAFTDHGKSTYLRNIAFNMFMNYPKMHILYYAFEGTRDDNYEAITRLYFYDKYENGRTKNYTQKEYHNLLTKAYDEKTEDGAISIGLQREICSRIHIDDRRCKPSEIEQHVVDSMSKINGSISVLIIDYLQDLKSDRHYEKGHSEIEQTLENLEDITKQNNLATIIAAQYGTPDNLYKGKSEFVGLTKVFGSSSAYKKSQLFLSIWNETAYQREFVKGSCQNPKEQDIEIDIMKQKAQLYGKNLPLKICSDSGRIYQKNPYEVYA